MINNSTANKQIKPVNLKLSKMDADEKDSTEEPTSEAAKGGNVEDRPDDDDGEKT